MQRVAQVIGLALEWSPAIQTSACRRRLPRRPASSWRRRWRGASSPTQQQLIGLLGLGAQYGIILPYSRAHERGRTSWDWT
jgi:hypothetical protein